jgi:hypothetical protein
LLACYCHVHPPFAGIARNRLVSLSSTIEANAKSLRGGRYPWTSRQGLANSFLILIGILALSTWLVSFLQNIPRFLASLCQKSLRPETRRISIWKMLHYWNPIFYEATGCISKLAFLLHTTHYRRLSSF